jgi:hypothetical protein
MLGLVADPAAATTNRGEIMSSSAVKLGGVVADYVAAVNEFDEGIWACFVTPGGPRLPKGRLTSAVWKVTGTSVSRRSTTGSTDR